LRYADEIFVLGAELETALGNARGGQRTLDFRVGIADSVPKAIAYRLLEPALAVPAQVGLICHEGKFQDLLAQISVHRLDLVIADEAMSKQTSVKAFNHALGTTAMSFFAAAKLKRELKAGFPKCLDGAPMPGSSNPSGCAQHHRAPSTHACRSWWWLHRRGRANPMAAALPASWCRGIQGGQRLSVCPWTQGAAS